VVCLSFIITIIFYFIILATAALVCTDDKSNTIYANLFYQGKYIADELECEEYLFYFKDVWDGLFNLIVLQVSTPF